MNSKYQSLIMNIAHGQSGIFKTNIAGIKFFYFDKPMQRQPRMYDAGIIIILQGSKTGYLHEEEIIYDAENYLVVAAPLPLECDAYASSDKPLLGFSVDINLALLQDIWAKLEQSSLAKGIQESVNIKVAHATKITPDMQLPIERIITNVLDREKSNVLGTDIIKELFYYTLKGTQASLLYTLADRNSHFTRIAYALNYIQQHISDTITIDALANISGMSVANFHRIFKRITGNTPLQYIKDVRLSSARDLIELHGMKINLASSTVGYESSSQFSREFKRHFGMSPSQLNI